MKKRHLKKRVIVLGVIILALILGFIFYPRQSSSTTPKKQTVKVKKQTKKELSYYKKENAQRYQEYQKQHPEYSHEDVVTYVNMNLDYDFYGKIIRQDHPNDLDTIVNKYYQLDPSYAPDDLVEINDQATPGSYGYPYRSHLVRKCVYDDFQALRKACQEKGFELYVASGYRSTKWQDEIYNHMANTYNQAKADETCSRPGHSEHTTGLSMDIGLDQYKLDDVIKHPQYQWFVSKLADYGFIIRYPDQKDKLTGYLYESWHLRYLGKDLAKKVSQSKLTYDEYYARHH